MAFKVKFWGTRGTVACPGPNHLAFGGNTSCVEVAMGGRRVIFDLGTGVLFRTARPDPAARAVLDLGCGYGLLAVALAAGAYWWLDRPLPLASTTAEPACATERAAAPAGLTITVWKAAAVASTDSAAPVATLFITALFQVVGWIGQAGVLATAYRHMVGIRV